MGQSCAGPAWMVTLGTCATTCDPVPRLRPYRIEATRMGEKNQGGWKCDRGTTKFHVAILRGKVRTFCQKPSMAKYEPVVYTRVHEIFFWQPQQTGLACVHVIYFFLGKPARLMAAEAVVRPIAWLWCRYSSCVGRKAPTVLSIVFYFHPFVSFTHKHVFFAMCKFKFKRAQYIRGRVAGPPGRKRTTQIVRSQL